MTVTEQVLSHIRVHDAMHTGLLVTDTTTPVRVVARLMAEQRVHAVAVADPAQARRPFGLVSALDVAVAISAGADDAIAGQLASSEVVTITANQSVADAALLMADYGVDHLLVIEPHTGHPTGILSSLDVAAAYAM